MRTQRDLVDKLFDDGFKCTQATISRDIAVMGLEKVPEGFDAEDGVYAGGAFHPCVAGPDAKGEALG